MKDRFGGTFYLPKQNFNMQVQMNSAIDKFKWMIGHLYIITIVSQHRQYRGKISAYHARGRVFESQFGKYVYLRFYDVQYSICTSFITSGGSLFNCVMSILSFNFKLNEFSNISSKM